MVWRRLPERYRVPVTAVIFSPMAVFGLAYIGEIFLDDSFGPHWTKALMAWLVMGDLALIAVLALLFGVPLFPKRKPTTASISVMFLSMLALSTVFLVAGLFEAFIYPAFALHGWKPERFVSHGFQMFLFGGILIWAGISARRKLLKKWRDELND